MVDALHIMLGVLLVASLAAILLYALAFFALASWTVLAGSRRDPLADELDRFLAEIATPGPAGAPPEQPLPGWPSGVLPDRTARDEDEGAGPLAAGRRP